MTTTIKAAMGKVKITPEEPAPLQGYDPDTNIADPRSDVLDDLYARILIVDDGKARSVIVGIDCCLSNEEVVRVADPGGKPGVYRAFIPTFPSGTRAAWAAAAGVPEASVSVNPTHTHTAPAQFQEKILSGITAAIASLRQRLVPVTLQACTGQSGISAFRRPHLNADLSVSIHRDFTLVRLVKEDGEPLGYMINFAVHPTAVRNSTSRISADIVGLAMSELEAEAEEGIVALFLQGFSGDVCPLYGDNGPKEDTYPAVRAGARVFSEELKEAMNRLTDVRPGAIKAVQTECAYPTREGFYASELSVRLSGIAFGDIALLSVSGEVFNAYADRIKENSPFPYTLTCGVANGYAGYIPSHTAFRDGLGGYEMNTTPYADDVEARFLADVEELLAALKQQQ
ncbi:hypothetical protein GZH47_08155 [Paenibacillus rhizovicinus]|uniref:Uncharacterized protein n=1 Tax=Paenibacillus rhizovicinus TaxID=2704463 RepID=A0A6C0NY11_9BACL|nr:hypothetical protein [Paenibacillus rhizovicinus]QHW30826.1 hypothetical protein GZH47_08155 [Paenibacillus rhizovicinus]